MNLYSSFDIPIPMHLFAEGEFGDTGGETSLDVAPPTRFTHGPTQSVLPGGTLLTGRCAAIALAAVEYCRLN